VWSDEACDGFCIESIPDGSFVRGKGKKRGEQGEEDRQKR